MSFTVYKDLIYMQDSTVISTCMRLRNMKANPLGLESIRAPTNGPPINTTNCSGK
jgi:hypothetical protein